MNISKEFKSTVETIKSVFYQRKYLMIFIIAFLVVFSILYYFMVAKIADNSLKIAIMMSGSVFVTITITFIFIISTLFGLYISLLSFKIVNSLILGSQSSLGIIGGTLGAFGVGCPTCGAVLFSLIGAPLALTYLPFRGIELQIVGIVFLVFSVYIASKSIRGCDIKYS